MHQAGITPACYIHGYHNISYCCSSLHTRILASYPGIYRNNSATYFQYLLTYDSVIINSHAILPSGMLDRNIVIDDGRIVSFTTDVPQCDAIIDGAGMVAIPGVIDPHVHYGVYSPIDEAARSESRAAALGGVTTMVRMLRHGSSYRESLQSHLEASASNHYIDYTLHASIFDHAQVEEMEYIRQQGIASFKIYMNLGSDVGHVYMDMLPGSSGLWEAHVELDDHLIEEIVKKAAGLGSVVCVHAEDYEMCSCGIRQAREESRDGLAAWSSSRPPSSEALSIKKVSALARRYGCTLYFVHIGSRSALEQIRVERAAGTRIFVETCPHYLFLSHEEQDGYLAKVMPPIRSRDDTGAVWQALCNGEIDTIGTDHVANSLGLKLGGNDVWDALAGFPGIGTSLPLLLSEGVRRGRLDLDRLVKICSLNAARIFSMYPKKGTLEVGSDADIVLLDLDMEAKVSSELFGGFSDYSVYDNWSLKGWPQKTMVRGGIVADAFDVIQSPGWGRMVRRPVS